MEGEVFFFIFYQYEHYYAVHPAVQVLLGGDFHTDRAEWRVLKDSLVSLSFYGHTFCFALLL